MDNPELNISIEQICKVIDLITPCIDDYLYVYDFTNDFYHISSNALQKFPVPGKEFNNVVENHGKFVYAQDLEMLQNDLDELLSGKKDSHNLQYRWIDLHNNPIWINCRGYISTTPDGSKYMVGCINEIGSQQKADNVSGLLGSFSLRTFIQEKLTDLSAGFILRLGLDDFKDINENFGIEYGDMILKETAKCISACTNSFQMLYRVVSDEFIILDLHNSTKQDAIDLYVAIRNELTRFVESSNYKAMITISGGILTSESTTDTSYSNIMKLSEFSLNEAKRQGKNRYYCFDQTDYDLFLRKNELTHVVRQAVDNKFEGFEAYFQPLYCSDSKALYGAETLMRLNTKEFGRVSPAEFIPILEETGLIIPAGKWILHEALSACKKFQEFIPNFRISINVSYIQILKSDIINEIYNSVREYDIDPSCVIIELTESGMLDSDSRFTKLWTMLKDHGIHLALDDFGTGYSNFHYLYDLRPDIIKIDRSFTMKALANEYDYNLLALMSGMVHNLNLKMCIEGIETAEEDSKIQALSPDYSQGFFFGRPCPCDEFMQQFITPYV